MAGVEARPSVEANAMQSRTVPRSEDELKDWVGSYVLVSFLDHTEDTEFPAEIEIAGKLIRACANHIVVRSWECQPEDPDCQTQWCIVRGAILWVSVLSADATYTPKERV